MTWLSESPLSLASILKLGGERHAGTRMPLCTTYFSLPARKLTLFFASLTPRARRKACCRICVFFSFIFLRAEEQDVYLDVM